MVFCWLKGKRSRKLEGGKRCLSADRFFRWKLTDDGSGQCAGWVTNRLDVHSAIPVCIGVIIFRCVKAAGNKYVILRTKVSLDIDGIGVCHLEMLLYVCTGKSKVLVRSIMELRGNRQNRRLTMNAVGAWLNSTSHCPCSVLKQISWFWFAKWIPPWKL